VLFDDRQCAVTSSSSTQIVCTTINRPYTGKTPTTVISFDGMGKAANGNHGYRYVSLFSETTTWGGDIPPLDGESVHIPSGLHLLFDMDSSPMLNLVLIEGSLMFEPNTDPQHLRTFDATFIMVNGVGSYFELGTEEFPYTSKMLITMHATRFSPSFAIYGNKMIGCRFCTLSMHGIPKTTTWTRLSETASAGAT
jgi:hypothetical protein